MTIRTRLKLYDYAPAKSSLFVPQNLGSGPPIPSPLFFKEPFSQSPTPNAASGSATPLPDGPFSSTPAWNPSHMLEMDPDSPSNLIFQQPDPDTPNAVIQQLPTDGESNPLLDSRLLGVPLKVTAQGGWLNNKDIVVSIQYVEGRLAFQYKRHKTMTTLKPEWVTPKHPHPTRGKNLLVVIRGDHFGKYVGRIYHRYEGTKVLITLCVVERLAGQQDRLTGEELALEPSHLCICEESEGDKLNALLEPRREDARKIRAK